MDSRSQAYASHRKSYKPPPFGFSDVRFFVDKFEASRTPVTSDLPEYQLKSYSGDFPSDDSASSGETVVWKIVFLRLGGILNGCIPRVTLGSLGVFTVAAGVIAPKMITYLLLYPCCRLLFGTLYPAYASYKAVRTKNLKEYVKWMMYWIVFALFTCAETFTDVFLSWFPFYYEIKIILVLWLLSPATKGSSILYRKFVHPALSRREQEIDDAISKAKEQGYHTVLNLGTKGVNYATAVIMQTAIRGGGGLVQQLKKSYSLSDLTESIPQSRSEQDIIDEADDVLTDPRLIRRSVARSGYNTRRSASESNNRTPLYFPEVDVDVRTTRSSHPQDFSHIKSSEDISSGYSSADNSATREQGLSRTGSVGGSGRLRARQVTTRSTITTIKRPGAAEGSEVIIEELHDNDNVDYDDLPPLLTLPPTCHISQTNPPFLFEYVGNQIRIIKILGDVSPTFINDDRTFDILQASQFVNADETINRPKIEVGESSKLNIIPDSAPSDLGEIVPANEQQAKTKTDSEKTMNDNKNISNVPSPVVDEDVGNKTDEICNKSDEVCNKIDEVCNKTDKLCNKTDEVCNKSDEICNKTNEVCNIIEELTNKSHEIKQECIKISISSDKNTDAILTADCKGSHSISSSNASLNSAKRSPSTDKEETEVASIGTSSLNDDAAETDDEASYGTPEDSPKARKKTKRGKYGKNRAPAPPKLPDIQDDKSGESVSICSTPMNNENETAVLIQSNLVLDSEVMKEIGSIATRYSKPTWDAHGHISKNNRKSKSPAGRKTVSSPISKLMQLPGKLAFWHKTGDKEIANSSSEEHSRRSSTVERVDDFQSCVDLQDTAKTDSVDNGGPNQNIPTITLYDSVGKDEETGKRIPLTEIDDLEEAKIAKDILDKSDALQKLIDAKLESHPEYKTVPLHGEEMPTFSKSTEV